MPELAYRYEDTADQGVAAMSSDAPTTATGEEVTTLETRFGTFSFAAEQVLDLPQGLLGFADKHAYGLAKLPNDTNGQFKVLQCLTDANLSFIVLPVPFNAGLIDAADLIDACQTLGISAENAAILLIVTIRPQPTGIKLTCNLQAPVILDTERRVGWQHVLHNNRYAVQHPL